MGKETVTAVVAPDVVGPRIDPGAEFITLLASRMRSKGQNQGPLGQGHPSHQSEDGLGRDNGPGDRGGGQGREHGLDEVYFDAAKIRDVVDDSDGHDENDEAKDDKRRIANGDDASFDGDLVTRCLRQSGPNFNMIKICGLGQISGTFLIMLKIMCDQPWSL